MRVTPLGKSASVASALMRHRTMCLRHFETVCGCGEILLGSISPSSYPPFFCVATRPKSYRLTEDFDVGWGSRVEKFDLQAWETV